jgi:hypothetical protein
MASSALGTFCAKTPALQTAKNVTTVNEAKQRAYWRTVCRHGMEWENSMG